MPISWDLPISGQDFTPRDLVAAAAINAYINSPLSSPTPSLALAFPGGKASVASTITAFATGGQPSATLLTAVINRVTTVGSPGDSVKLPPAAPPAGMELFVANAGANSANVFPSSGDQINALGINAAFALAAGKNVTFHCTAPGQWHAVLSG